VTAIYPYAEKIIVRKAFLPISGFKFVQTKFAKLLRMAIALLEIHTPVGMDLLKKTGLGGFAGRCME